MKRQGNPLGYKEAGYVPNITADFGGLAQYGPSGAVINTGTQKGNVQSTASQIAQWNFNASRSSSIYANVDGVYPRNLAIFGYLIKY